MEQPIRIQRSRQAGARLVSPNGLPVVYVGRPTIWGNPFTLEMFHAGWVGDDSNARRHCVDAYRAWLIGWNRHFMFYEGMPQPPTDFHKLADCNLACWCPLVDPLERPVPCHADVLLEFAALTTDGALFAAINRERFEFQTAYDSLHFYTEWQPNPVAADHYAQRIGPALDKLEDYYVLARRRGMNLDDPTHRTLTSNQIAVVRERK